MTSEKSRVIFTSATFIHESLGQKAVWANRGLYGTITDILIKVLAVGSIMIQADRKLSTDFRKL